MRVAVIENMRISHTGQVGVALAEAGADIDVIRAYAGEPLPSGTGDYDALVVLGGEQNARDDDRHPYLPELASLMRAYGDAGKAVLGICLGSQLLARAYGGDNVIGGAPEFGWQAIQLTPDSNKDPVLSAAVTGFPTFQWHDDTFTLPEGAVRLAENTATPNQAFRVGRAAYGMQFHFEASRAVVDAWKADFAEVIAAKAPGWLDSHSEHAERHGPDADAAGLAIARAWVAQI